MTKPATEAQLRETIYGLEQMIDFALSEGPEPDDAPGAFEEYLEGLQSRLDRARGLLARLT